MGGDGGALRIQVLGPVRAWRDQRELGLGPPRQRSVLAVLAMAAGRAVSRVELIDAVWDAPTDRAAAALYAYISRLRGVLEPSRDPHAPRYLLVSDGSGYLLRIEPGQLDAAVFAEQAAAARHARGAGDPAAAAELLQSALRLWEGTALAGVDGPWARSQRLRLEDARLSVLETQAELELELGRHAEAVSDLSGWVSRYPLHEGLAGLLMLALYRGGRQAEALSVFRDTRRVLAAELAIEPGPELRRLHEQVLTADPALDLPMTAPISAPTPETTTVTRSAPVPQELPGDVIGFTGRAAELTALDALLPGAVPPETGITPEAAAAQAVTIAPGPVVISAVSGTAGVGKTALAVRWGHRVADVFPDGQLYVNLRGYDPDQPVPAGEALAGFLRALGVPDQAIPLGEAERAARFRSEVAGKRLLIVLDNAATVEQVRPLLPGSPSVLVVVTSRDTLAGLVAKDGAQRLDLDLLPTTDAVDLLRALIGDRVDADPAAAEDLASLCARLPLALRVAAELAVSRQHTPLAELAADLAGQQDRLELLDAGGDPHGAVASVFSWSYRQLTSETARMFRLLGLHPGADWDRRGAAGLAAIGVDRAGRLLTELTRAHLLQPVGPRRYGVHDLLRGYAASLAARHDSSQDRQAALIRLSDYYLATCSAAMDVLAPAQSGHRPAALSGGLVAQHFSTAATARAWLDAELATLTDIAAHASIHGLPGHAIRLAATLHYYLDGDHDTEAFTIHSHALEAARDCGDLAAQARELADLANLHSHQGRHEQAAGYLRQALDIAHNVGDRDSLRRTLMRLGMVYFRQGYYQQAADCYQESLALARDLGDQIHEALNLTNLGNVSLRLGRYQQAAGHQQRALDLFSAIGHQRGVVIALVNLGEVCYRLGRYEQAAEYQRRALTVSAPTGDRYTEAGALTKLGEILHRQGHYSRAAASHEQALTVSQEIGEPEGEADALNGAGAAWLATGQPERAYDRHAAALVLTRRVGDPYQQIRSLIGLGKVCHWQGRLGQARDYHEQALELCRELGDHGGEADALNGLAQALLATGQPDQAHAHHTAALALARKTGDRYQQAHAHQGLAVVCDALGRADQGRQHRERSATIYTSLGIPGAPAGPA